MLVKGAIRPNAILVPHAAVLQGAGGFLVCIVDKDGNAEPRPIEAGDWRGDNGFVLNGLSAGIPVGTASAGDGAAATQGAPSAQDQPERRWKVTAGVQTSEVERLLLCKPAMNSLSK
jgi:Tol biopolymer transport system component